MQANDIMTAGPAVVRTDASLQHVARLMVDYDCGAIPIVTEDGNRPVGIVTDRDITTRAVAEGRNPLEMQADEVMTRNVVTVDRHAPVEDCAALMEKEQVRRVVVVDNNGTCLGIIAQADIARETSEAQTGEVVEDVSQPTPSASAPSRT